jgi:hypothetical protein
MAAHSHKLNTVTVSSWGLVRCGWLAESNHTGQRHLKGRTSTEHFVTPPSSLARVQEQGLVLSSSSFFLSRFVLSGRGLAARKTDERETPRGIRVLRRAGDRQRYDAALARELRPAARLGSCVSPLFSLGVTHGAVVRHHFRFINLRFSSSSLSFAFILQPHQNNLRRRPPTDRKEAEDPRSVVAVAIFSIITEG